MATFILIHGAWQGGWCWERIVPLLEAQGHRVLAPDLPGMGEDPTPLAEITLDRWVQFVCGLVSKQKEKVILVGHSRGGLIISQVAEYLPDHIHSLIYLAAILVPNGGTLISAIQQHGGAPLELTFSADGNTSTVTPATVGDALYNTTSEVWLARALSLLGAEPMISFQTPVMLSDNNFGRVPRIYIECLQDKAIPIATQRGMVSEMQCLRVVSLETDHSPFYSAPEELATQLIDLAGLLLRLTPDQLNA